MTDSLDWENPDPERVTLVKRKSAPQHMAPERSKVGCKFGIGCDSDDLTLFRFLIDGESPGGLDPYWYFYSCDEHLPQEWQDMEVVEDD